MAITARIPDDESAIPQQVADLRRAIRELGPSVAASLLPVVSDLQTTIEARLAANYYTRAQTDAAVATKVASPGNIAPGTVSASGDVTTTGKVTASGQVTGDRVVSTQPLQSPGSYNYQVTSGYKAAWINADGQVGFSPSTRRVKKDLEPLPDDLADAALAMGAYLGRYTWDEDDSPLKVFLIAEEAQAAGFGPDVVPVDEDGDPETVNYSQFVVPLLAVAKRHDSRLDALEQRLDALVV